MLQLNMNNNKTKTLQLFHRLSTKTLYLILLPYKKYGPCRILINSLFLVIIKLFLNAEIKPGEEELDFMLNKVLKSNWLKIFLFFNEQIFESMCIQIEFSVTKKVNFISIYRPPCNHPLLSVNQQLESFLDNFEELLVNIGTTETYICTASNINLIA